VLEGSSNLHSLQRRMNLTEQTCSVSSGLHSVVFESKIVRNERVSLLDSELS
jgi:hypothetical protein